MPSNFDIRRISAFVATTETAITHTLGRVPVDSFIVRRNGSGNVFRGPTAWSSTTIYLQASVSVDITFLLF